MRSFLFLGVVVLVGCGQQGQPAQPVAKNAEAPNAFDIIDFVDHADKYASREITIPVRVVMKGGLKNIHVLTPDMPFALVGKAKGTINIDIPPNTPNVPNAEAGEQVIITFVCTQGHIQYGNIARTVTRP